MINLRVQTLGFWIHHSESALQISAIHTMSYEISIIVEYMKILAILQ